MREVRSSLIQVDVLIGCLQSTTVQCTHYKVMNNEQVKSTTKAYNEEARESLLVVAIRDY